MIPVPRQETRVGWCPSVATPMAASDGLLVRIKPTAATLTVDAVRTLADAAAHCGNGKIDLTNRSNLQIRGLRPETTAPFADAVRSAGLASADPKFEEIRNVSADPLGPADPAATHDSHALARALEAALAQDARLLALPPKFGFLVDCGHSLPVPDGRADIIVRDRDDMLAIALDGGTSALPCTPEEAPALACRLALAFLVLAGPADAPPYRMRELVAEIGEDAVFDRAGLSVSDVVSQEPPHLAPDQVRGVGLSYGRSIAAGTEDSPDLVRSIGLPDGHDFATGEDDVPDWIRDPGAARQSACVSPTDDPLLPSSPGMNWESPGESMVPWVVSGHDARTDSADASPRERHLALMYAAPPPDSPVGYVAFPGRNEGTFVAGVPGGRLTPKTLTGLAAIAERHADATLRMTPWRAIVFAPVRADDVHAVTEALCGLDLITNPADPRRRRRGPATLSTDADDKSASKDLVR